MSFRVHTKGDGFMPKLPNKQTLGKIVKTVATPVAEAVEESITENKEAKKPSVLGSIAKAGLEVAKQALPTALSLVPGVGPVLSSLSQGLLSTMNDDEWFEEFKSAGATFNEMLASKRVAGSGASVSPNDVNLQTLVGAVGVYQCHINLGSGIKENVFPAFLNYVRSKTENVLVDDTDKYWYSIGDVVQLYAIYYNIMKYLKFAENLPLNAPTLPDVLVAANPIINSQIAGIASTLRDFLRASTGIPYALREYLRWRFGTAFLSENSAKAGIIVYDVDSVYLPDNTAYNLHWLGAGIGNTITQNATNLITELTNAISALKNDILLQGRANADVALAFKSHATRYDVEERHYDEKEFNLRCNLTCDNQLCFTAPDHNRLLLDSRLDINAAIQAITISTRPRGSGDPTDVVDEINSHGYGVYKDTSFIHVVDTKIVTNVVGLSASAATIFNGALFEATYNGTNWAAFSIADTVQANNAGTRTLPVPTAILSYDQNSQDQITFENCGISSRQVTTVSQYISAWVYKVLAISLQMHYNDVVFFVGIGIPNASVLGDATYLQSAPLAYDTAEVTDDQLAAIQRCAVRNLFRGSYTNKQPVKPAVAEAVADVVDIATDSAKVDKIA
jgi:hypothetical protein